MGEVKPETDNAPRAALHGWIAHTEVVSSDPAATKAWCERVFGWKFHPPIQSPRGVLFGLSDP